MGLFDVTDGSYDVTYAGLEVTEMGLAEWNVGFLGIYGGLVLLSARERRTFAWLHSRASMIINFSFKMYTHFPPKEVPDKFVESRQLKIVIPLMQ
jgi:hypothetical protein